jgi:hypothetical protein
MRSLDCENLLCVTATVNPSSQMPKNALRDPDVRLRQYGEALKSYLALPPPYPDAILYCENSGADLSYLHEIADKDNPYQKAVEFWQFAPEAPPEFGKGFAELEILDRAFVEHLARLPESTVVWKVTGRLAVSNFPALMASRPQDCIFYIDMRKLPFLKKSGSWNHYADTRIMAYTASGYLQTLYGFKDGKSYASEKTLFDHLYPIVTANPRMKARFREQPIVHGVDGTLLKDYGETAQILKNTVRATARRLVPGLWI